MRKEKKDNTNDFDVLFQARKITLTLSWRKIYTNERANCPMCDFEIETVTFCAILPLSTKKT